MHCFEEHGRQIPKNTSERNQNGILRIKTKTKGDGMKIEGRKMKMKAEVMRMMMKKSTTDRNGIARNEDVFKIG